MKSWVCPLCDKELSGCFTLLGLDQQEGKDYHIRMHIRPLREHLMEALIQHRENLPEGVTEPLSAFVEAIEKINEGQE